MGTIQKAMSSLNTKSTGILSRELICEHVQFKATVFMFKRFVMGRNRCGHTQFEL